MDLCEQKFTRNQGFVPLIFFGMFRYLKNCSGASHFLLRPERFGLFPEQNPACNFILGNV